MSAGRGRGTQESSGRRKAATLHAVAQLAGVSTATVSKALNGIAVSPDNLARVLAAADELGYVPNEAARSIRGGPTMTVGIVIHFDLHPRFELMAIVDRTIRVMEAQGYSVFLSVSGGSAEVDTLLRRYAERRVDGLIFWNAENAPSLDLYRRGGVPVLAVGFRDPRWCDLPTVRVDSTEAYRNLYRKMKRLGHRRIHEIDPGQAAPTHQSTAAEFGIEWQPLATSFGPDAVRRTIESLASRGTPLALLAPYPVTLDIFTACDELGLDIPNDVTIVASTDSAGAELLRTPVTAIRTDWERIGEASAEALLGALAGHPLDDVLVPDCVEFMDRASIGPGRRRRAAAARS
ncbi:MAG: LacI family DNA-binding transcriptional regulator [Ilumatobacteraceae bacterium]